MRWDLVTERLWLALDRLAEVVERHYPALSVNREGGKPGYMRFSVGFTYCYDRARQEFEDLYLHLDCTDAPRFWDEAQQPVFPESPGDAVGFEMERGNGQRVAALEPVLLPADDTTEEYERVVLDYAARTETFITEQTPLILETLRVPFVP